MSLEKVKELGLCRDEECREVLLERLEDKNDTLDAVIILELSSSGKQKLFTSKASGMEKAFLVQYAQAVMADWFLLE